MSAYVGSSKNLKDIKDGSPPRGATDQFAGELIRSVSISHHISVGYRERRCGFITEHQSTPASCWHASRSTFAGLSVWKEQILSWDSGIFSLLPQGLARDPDLCLTTMVYRGTWPTRKRPPPQDPSRSLGIGLRKGPKGVRF